MTFDEFWRVYPKRRGVNPKQPARKEFERYVRHGVDPRDILEGARLYGAECDEEGKTGSPYVAHARTWLHQERWKDHLEAEKVSRETAERAREKSAEFKARMIRQGKRLTMWSDQEIRQLVWEGRITPAEARAAGVRMVS